MAGVDKHTESSRRHIPDAAAVNFLLGKLWASYGETTKAVEFFVEALKLNPFLWEAFIELCNTGMYPSPGCVSRLNCARCQDTSGKHFQAYIGDACVYRRVDKLCEPA
jgi:hypothetical protein